MRVRSLRRWYRSTVVEPSLPVLVWLARRHALLEDSFRRGQLADDEPRARYGGTELLPFVLVGYHAGYDDFELRNGRVIRPDSLEIVAGERASPVRVNLAQVIQINYRMRPFGRSQKLSHGS